MRTIGVVLAVTVGLAATRAAQHPGFLWLPPTVPTRQEFTGPFDATAREQLVVEVCALDERGARTGAPIVRFTAASSPMPERIRLDETQEVFAVDWLTARRHVEHAATT